MTSSVAGVYIRPWWHVRSHICGLRSCIYTSFTYHQTSVGYIRSGSAMLLLCVYMLALLGSGMTLNNNQLSEFDDEKVTITTTTGPDAEHTFESSGDPSHSMADTTECSPANSQSDQTYSWAFPKFPEIDNEQCLPMGAIGIALNGVPIYNPFNSGGGDAVQNECFDVCNGHAASGGRYHYHQLPICLLSATHVTKEMIGVALDGHPIYVTTKPNGDIKNRDDLDDCNGREVVINGVTKYQYWVTSDFPYIIGCFRGDVHNKSPSSTCQYACRGTTAGSTTACSAARKKSADKNKNKKTYSQLLNLLKELMNSDN